MSKQREIPIKAGFVFVSLGKEEKQSASIEVHSCHEYCYGCRFDYVFVVHDAPNIGGDMAWWEALLFWG